MSAKELSELLEIVYFKGIVKSCEFPSKTWIESASLSLSLNVREQIYVICRLGGPYSKKL